MNPYRLPQTVIPARYDLRLEPDLVAARFTGEVRIAIEVIRPVVHILLNAAELEIQSAEVIGHGLTIPALVKLAPAEERLHLELPSLLGPGAYSLRLTFTGTLNDKLRVPTSSNAAQAKIEKPRRKQRDDLAVLDLRRR